MQEYEIRATLTLRFAASRWNEALGWANNLRAALNRFFEPSGVEVET